MNVVELRCEGPPGHNYGRLFAKLLIEGEPQIIPGVNLVEVHCKNCSAANGARTLHRFAIDGQLVETEIDDD